MFDYKKFIKSRDVRIKVLRMLNFVPDSIMLRVQYFIKTGRLLHLKNPQRYTEKLQWYKLYYKDPLMAQCVDKYEVRKYVEQCGLGHILNECYGVFERVEDIDFDKLPNSFVLKDTLGGGGNDVIIVKDKTQADLNAIKKRLNEWVNRPGTDKSSGREWPYQGHKHRIIIEKNLLQPGVTDLPDYKFFCFGGNPVFCQVITDRHNGEKIDWFDMNWQHQPFTGIAFPFPFAEREPKCPFQLEKMKQFCVILAQPFPFVRVDFYEVDKQIVFGELTFYPASGYGYFTPDEYDFMLGKQFVLPNKRSK